MSAMLTLLYVLMFDCSLALRTKKTQDLLLGSTGLASIMPTTAKTRVVARPSEDACTIMALLASRSTT